ncbi:AAA family ATPase [Haloquadratum walsbyi]|jgi:cellulose biosynthesis protein BcsQ|uniref:ParA domain protein n=2 Tax=Haloquadratum walsbyi TaxID=293091 RepID=Q18E94_HALWD|nr:AAA family ATPase [Haloquadratum walsbyi]CAJ53739.1 ParA domain protein [Haloquadratum walsbyi DSM 16790]CCC41791.1 ParA domain protein [Haloquadratum walsbyi C23]
MTAAHQPTITAVIGATGGAGTTRTIVEVATTLARTGADVAVFDAAVGSQGLSDYVKGRLDPDLTTLLTDAVDTPLSDGLYALPWSDTVPGRLAVCPIMAPFERLARAQSVAAAKQFETRTKTAATQFDTVLVDVPPISANLAVAAAHVADHRIVMMPATNRGVTALQRMHDRLADLQFETSITVSTFGNSDEAEIGIPTLTGSDTMIQSAPYDANNDTYATSIAHFAAVTAGESIEQIVDDTTDLPTRLKQRFLG